jgi:hypothetical protein
LGNPFDGAGGSFLAGHGLPGGTGKGGHPKKAIGVRFFVNPSGHLRALLKKAHDPENF